MAWSENDTILSGILAAFRALELLKIRICRAACFSAAFAQEAGAPPKAFRGAHAERPAQRLWGAAPDSAFLPAELRRTASPARAPARTSEGGQDARKRAQEPPPRGEAGFGKTPPAAASPALSLFPRGGLKLFGGESLQPCGQTLPDPARNLGRLGFAAPLQRKRRGPGARAEMPRAFGLEARRSARGEAAIISPRQQESERANSARGAALLEGAGREKTRGGFRCRRPPPGRSPPESRIGKPTLKYPKLAGAARLAQRGRPRASRVLSGGSRGIQSPPNIVQNESAAPPGLMPPTRRAGGPHQLASPPEAKKSGAPFSPFRRFSDSFCLTDCPERRKIAPQSGPASALWRFFSKIPKQFRPFCCFAPPGPPPH
jgi:hypothetical protein